MVFNIAWIEEEGVIKPCSLDASEFCWYFVMEWFWRELE